MTDQAIFNRITFARDIIADMNDLCEGLRWISREANGEHMGRLTTGLFGLLSLATDIAYGDLDGAERAYKSAHNVKERHEMCDNEVIEYNHQKFLQREDAAS